MWGSGASEVLFGLVNTIATLIEKFAHEGDEILSLAGLLRWWGESDRGSVVDFGLRGFGQFFCYNVQLGN